MAMKSYQCLEDGFRLTDEMKASYSEDGYVLVRKLFSQKELDHIERAFTTGAYSDYTYGMYDGEGGEVQTVVWSNPGHDVLGMVTRSNKVAGTCEHLLGGDVYHYHSKINMKVPQTGGKFLWHQDYGYWYDYGGFMRPDMISVFIAMDECDKENGCLQVLKGSHKAGRIEHGSLQSQIVANLTRVEQLKKHFPLEYVEMKPGDALFMHCNVLHCSENNASDKRRWALLSAYSRKDNYILDVPNASYPMGYGHHFEKVDDSAILDCTEFNNIEDKQFLLTKPKQHPSHLIGKKQQEA